MARKALITGANRGIGFEIAKGLADNGYDVIVGSRNLENGERAAVRIGARAVRLDVTDEESIRLAVEQAGPVDVLVNNAGVLGSGGILDDPRDFAACMTAMVEGPFHLTRLVVPSMIGNRYGRIVNVSSGWGSFAEGLRGPGAYGVAKAALNALTLSAANSLPATVKVNAMCPGWVATRMGGRTAPRTPREGADTAIWLATLGQTGPTGGFFRRRQSIEW